MCELALACSDLKEKRRWLEEAARNGWQAAMMELAEICDCEGHISHGSRMHVGGLPAQRRHVCSTANARRGSPCRPLGYWEYRGFMPPMIPAAVAIFSRPFISLGRNRDRPLAYPPSHARTRTLFQEHWTEILASRSGVDRSSSLGASTPCAAGNIFVRMAPSPASVIFFPMLPGVCWVVVVRIAVPPGSTMNRDDFLKLVGLASDNDPYVPVAFAS